MMLDAVGCDMKKMKCLLGRHDFETLETIPLKGKTDGRLKLTLADFDRCDIGEATYWATIRRCRLCGKTETEIL